MSQEDAKQFIEKLKSDQSAREGLATAIRDGAANSVSNFGSSHGLNFSGAEFVKAYRDLMREHAPSSEDFHTIAPTAGPDQAEYAASPDASYAAHPAYAASPDDTAQYAEPDAASYAEPASAHYADSSDEN